MNFSAIYEETKLFTDDISGYREQKRMNVLQKKISKLTNIFNELDKCYSGFSTSPNKETKDNHLTRTMYKSFLKKYFGNYEKTLQQEEEDNDDEFFVYKVRTFTDEWRNKIYILKINEPFIEGFFKWIKTHLENIIDFHEEQTNNNNDKFCKLITDKIKCPCGGSYTYKNKATHIETLKHQKYESGENEEDEEQEEP